MLIFFAVLFGIIAALGLAYWRWSAGVKAEIAIGAETAWARFQETEPAFVDHLDQARFTVLYARAHFPRFPKYALVCIAGFAAALPAVFALLGGFLWLLDATGITAEPAELAKYIPIGEAQTTVGQEEREEVALYLAKDFAGFYYFFGVIGAWVALAAVAMRLYHGRRPGPLRDEIIRARDAHSE
ncbi:MAG: hypothetical protein AAF224_00990 [Pseudomonadota bacterium]